MNKVLVIDDSRMVRERCRMLLRESGCEVVPAGNGLDGIEKLRQHPDIGLVLLDIRMPVMNGLAFLAALREFRNRPPAVLMAMRSEEADVLRGLDLGACGAVEKYEHLEAIQGLVRCRQQPASGRC